MSGETLQMAVVLQQLRNEGIAAEVAKAMRLYRSELIASGKRPEAERLVQACLTDEERGATPTSSRTDPTPELLELLRANGVTRYKRSERGAVEIELGPAPDLQEPWPGAFEQLQRALVEMKPSLHAEPDDPDDPDDPDEPLSPLPPLGEIRQRSADLRRQQAEDRSGVDVTETGK